MNVRYYVELIIFLLLLIYFLQNIDHFNNDNHELKCDYAAVQSLEANILVTDPSSIVDVSLLKECVEGQLAAFVNQSQEEVLVSLKEEMAKEIKLAVTELNKSMYVAMIAFSFPLQIIGQYIYSKLTKRVYYFRVVNGLDLTIFILVCVWFERFKVYSQAETMALDLRTLRHTTRRS